MHSARARTFAWWCTALHAGPVQGRRACDEICDEEPAKTNVRGQCCDNLHGKLSVVLNFVQLALIGALLTRRCAHPVHSTNSQITASALSLGRPSPCAAINLSLDLLLHDSVFHSNRNPLFDVCTPSGQVRVVCLNCPNCPNCARFPPRVFPNGVPDCANNSQPGMCRDGGVEVRGVIGHQPRMPSLSWDPAIPPTGPLELPVILCSTLYRTLLFCQSPHEGLWHLQTTLAYKELH